MATAARSTTSTPASTPVSEPLDLTPSSVRKNAGLTQSEMATLIGMSEFGYAQWEAGTRRAGGPAYRLLHLIQRDGSSAIEALKTFKDD